MAADGNPVRQAGLSLCVQAGDLAGEDRRMAGSRTMELGRGPPMIDTVLNLIFRCSHRRITRPITPVKKPGERYGGTYVVCLDCGKQFDYDAKAMWLRPSTSCKWHCGAPAR